MSGFEAPQETTSFLRQQKRALRRFGYMLRKWRELNEWTIYTAEQWGRAAGFAAPAKDKISRLERAEVANPETVTLFRFADVNRRIARQDWGTIKSAKLRMLIVTAKPIADDETNTPWGPKQFWSAMMGLEPIPAHLVVKDMPPLDLSLAASLSQRWHETFIDTVKEKGIKATVAAKKVLNSLPAHRREAVHELLLMGTPLDISQLEIYWFGEWQIETALSQWIQGLEADEEI